MPSSVNGMPRTPTMSEAPSTKVQQRLTSGTIITQDFRASVRFPIFETGERPKTTLNRPHRRVSNVRFYPLASRPAAPPNRALGAVSLSPRGWIGLT
jgi:hypothetical protein